MTLPSYDENQTRAVRIVCQSCGKSLWSTVPRLLCGPCEREKVEDDGRKAVTPCRNVVVGR